MVILVETISNGHRFDHPFLTGLRRQQGLRGIQLDGDLNLNLTGCMAVRRGRGRDLVSRPSAARQLPVSCPSAAGEVAAHDAAGPGQRELTGAALHRLDLLQQNLQHRAKRYEVNDIVKTPDNRKH